MEVAQYFSNLAAQATTELEKKFGNNPAAAIVRDTGQDAQMSAWQAIAVHPMQVLETQYQALVRANVASGKDDDDRRRREIEVLSRFFVTAGTEPQLLALDDQVAPYLPDERLVDREITSIRAKLALVRSLIDSGSRAAEVLSEMSTLVKRAADVLAIMAPASDPKAVALKLKAAFEYLGLFTTYKSPSEAAGAWASQYQNYQKQDDLLRLVGDLREKLVEPLADPGNAVASTRSLYSIEQFYLLRLMHRFHGGSSVAEMTNTMKQEASGLVTKAMHPAAWDWLTGWHENQIDALDNALGKLELSLRNAFGRTDPVLRFFLKGGRALYTALGTPKDGANDWDTGVLIDPSLAPSDWYRAFAAVNDVLTRMLDRVRFGYTQVVYQHSGNLRSGMAVMALAEADDEEMADFTRLGAEADELLRHPMLRSPSDAELSLMSPAALQAVANGEPRPVTVNGELIDIGIAKRSSVELREHWTHLTVTKRPGVSGIKIPVPDLAFFVDDFSTILRETITEPDKADRKLAKRLLRLQGLLASKDGTLGSTITQRLHELQEKLPKTVAELKPSPDTQAGRLQIWALGALLHDLGPQSAARSSYIGTFDDRAAADAHSGALFDETDKTLRTLWAQIQDAFSGEADKGEGAKTLLSIEVGVDKLAGRAIDDFRLREQSFRVADLQNAVPSGPWKTIGELLSKMSSLAKPSSGFGPLVVTGALAARLQLIHAALDIKLAKDSWPVELIELDWCMGQQDLMHAEECLKQLMGSVGNCDDVTLAVTGNGSAAMLTVSGKKGFINNIPDDPAPVILAIRPAKLSPAAYDFINGWAVMPSRSLALQWLDRAAGSADHGLRELARGSVKLVTEEILGRQL